MQDSVTYVDIILLLHFTFAYGCQMHVVLAEASLNDMPSNNKERSEGYDMYYIAECKGGLGGEMYCNSSKVMFINIYRGRVCEILNIQLPYCFFSPLIGPCLVSLQNCTPRNLFSSEIPSTWFLWWKWCPSGLARTNPKAPVALSSASLPPSKYSSSIVPTAISSSGSTFSPHHPRFEPHLLQKARIQPGVAWYSA